jgi:signal transduction histidine kinase
VEITVVDEGVGFDTQRAAPPSGKRFGLAQLRERVRAAGGTLDIDAVIGEGCRVTVRLPAPGHARPRVRRADDAGFRPVHGEF